MDLRNRTPRRPWPIHWPPRWSFQGKGTQHHLHVYPRSRSWSWCVPISRPEYCSRSWSRTLNSHGEHLRPQNHWDPLPWSKARCQGLPHLQWSWCLTGQGTRSLLRSKLPGSQSPRRFGDTGCASRCNWPKQPSHRRSLYHLGSNISRSLSSLKLWLKVPLRSLRPLKLISITLHLYLNRCRTALFSSPGTTEKETSFECNTCNTSARDAHLLWNSLVFQRKRFVVDRKVEFWLEYQGHEGGEGPREWLTQSLHAYTSHKYELQKCMHVYAQHIFDLYHFRFCHFRTAKVLIPTDTFHVSYVCKLRILEPQVQEHSP